MAVLRRATVGLAALMFGLATLVFTAGPADAAGPYCGLVWGSQGEASGDYGRAPLGKVRTGRHECFDRVVFEVDGAAAGYRVEYVPEVRTEGEGAVLPLAGGAFLRVVVMANVFDDLGHLHYDARVGDRLNVKGYKTLRDVKYGGCFEGQSTFGVGVRARLPFRVFTLDGPGDHSRIVLDVAHRW
ncbi:MAG: hypothetical protein QOI98_3372 [Solirubrobacteraceae bacterium]|nr:hypothetical protein [Solirubrobacteraceae bacterium]